MSTIEYTITARPDGLADICARAKGYPDLTATITMESALRTKALVDGKTVMEARPIVAAAIREIKESRAGRVNATRLAGGEPSGMSLGDQLNLELSLPLKAGLDYVSDAHALRDKLRKAKHFRVDAKGSAYIAEASIAIADHLEEARELSRSPYPLMWVEIDNRARLNRVEELGVELSRRAKGTSGEGEPVPTVGWLIERHHNQPSAHRATYFTAVDRGCFMAPLAFTWDCDGLDCPWGMESRISERDLGAKEAAFMLGVPGAKCSAVWITPGWVYPHSRSSFGGRLLWEFAGELRYIFGFLTTIGHVPVEEREVVRIEGDVSKPPPIVKGKPVLALTYRDIIIKLPKHRDITKVVTRVCEGMRKKRHDVRGHWRHYYNEDGTLRRRVWIKEHERGDETLGRVVHVKNDYRVTT